VYSCACAAVFIFLAHNSRWRLACSWVIPQRGRHGWRAGACAHYECARVRRVGCAPGGSFPEMKLWGSALASNERARVQRACQPAVRNEGQRRDFHATVCLGSSARRVMLVNARHQAPEARTGVHPYWQSPEGPCGSKGGGVWRARRLVYVKHARALFIKDGCLSHGCSVGAAD